METNSYRAYIQKDIGALCAAHRIHVLQLTQKDVANMTGYCVQTISNFERGANNNAVLLIWYINQGLADNWHIPQYFGGVLYDQS